MTNFSITITSDAVCPWCYIGLRRLQAAIHKHLAKYSQDSFSINWRPFQLNPNTPKYQSFNKRNSYRIVLGDEQAKLVFERLQGAGREVGIGFKFGGRTGNTADSHRLIAFAGEVDRQGTVQSEAGYHPSVQTRLVEELFAAYFEREKDITDQGMLLLAAVRSGMNGREVTDFLNSSVLMTEVENEASEAREGGINGVPHFTINDIFTVEGAQEPNAFLMLFERLKKRASNL